MGRKLTLKSLDRLLSYAGSTKHLNDVALRSRGSRSTRMVSGSPLMDADACRQTGRDAEPFQHPSYAATECRSASG
jgi:hypothetical protein